MELVIHMLQTQRGLLKDEIIKMLQPQRGGLKLASLLFTSTPALNYKQSNAHKISVSPLCNVS